MEGQEFKRSKCFRIHCRQSLGARVVYVWRPTIGLALDIFRENYPHAEIEYPVCVREGSQWIQTL